MTNLHAIFADLVSHITLRAGEELPPVRPGVSWIWAANGVFKRGVDPHLDILIQVASSPRVPGLAELEPHVRFRQADSLIPGHLLDSILIHASCLRGIEQQYAIICRDDRFELLIPPQGASAHRVRYELIPGTLIDIHSHHQMGAFFSEVDDRDDLGLSVSAVIGRLGTRQPEIVMRANVYGHRQRIAPTDIFTRVDQLHVRKASYGSHAVR